MPATQHKGLLEIIVEGEEEKCNTIMGYRLSRQIDMKFEPLRLNPKPYAVKFEPLRSTSEPSNCSRGPFRLVFGADLPFCRASLHCWGPSCSLVIEVILRHLNAGAVLAVSQTLLS